MINKRVRKSATHVETLHQGGFTGVKGIDIHGSVLKNDTVIVSKNLDTDYDGTLILRKPVICVESIPNVIGSDGVEIPSNIIYVGRMFDPDYILVIRKDTSGIQYFGIFTDVDGTFKGVDVKLKWNTWKDYTEKYSPTLKSLNGYISNLYTYEDSAIVSKIPFIDFSNISVVNTPNTVTCTGVFVNIASRIFNGTDISLDTDLFFHKLYDFDSSTTPAHISVLRPRTISFIKADKYTFDATFVLSIITPVVDDITLDTIRLDTNLDLDQTYTIRDVYGTSAPYIKAIVPYVPVDKNVLVDTPTEDTEYESDSVLDQRVVDYFKREPDYEVNCPSYEDVTFDTRSNWMWWAPSEKEDPEAYSFCPKDSAAIYLMCAQGTEVGEGGYEGYGILEYYHKPSIQFVGNYSEDPAKPFVEVEVVRESSSATVRVYFSQTDLQETIAVRRNRWFNTEPRTNVQGGELIDTVYELKQLSKFLIKIPITEYSYAVSDGLGILCGDVFKASDKSEFAVALCNALYQHKDVSYNLEDVDGKSYTVTVYGAWTYVDKKYCFNPRLHITYPVFTSEGYVRRTERVSNFQLTNDIWR